MQFTDVLNLLSALPRAEKFRAVQFLASELASEEKGPELGAVDYPVWSPHEAHEAAKTLAEYLEIEKKAV